MVHFTSFLRKQPWHKKIFKCKISSILIDIIKKQLNAKFIIIVIIDDIIVRLQFRWSINIAGTVNRACRRPEVPTNHTERERGDLLVPRNELRN